MPSLVKRFIACVSFLCLLCAHAAYADTIRLKSGQSVEGTIVLESDDYVRIDIFGVVLTYFKEDIAQIDKTQQSSGVPVAQLPVSSTPVEHAPLPQTVSQEFSPRASVDPSPAVAQKCFLWQVQSNNARVYLLGSIHVLKSSMYPLDPRIEKAYENSDIVVVEANVNQANLLEQSSVLAKALYPENDALENHLSREGHEYMRLKLYEMGIDIALFRPYKPWFLGMQFTVLSIMQLGYDPQFGIDMHFLKKAQSQKKIEELESIAFQVDLLDSLSEKNQEYFLLASIKDSEQLRKEMDAFIDAWRAGDAVTLERYLFQSLRENPEFKSMYEALFFGRNKTMASKIEGFLSRGGNFFVIVGAGHLVGEEGIIALLKSKGLSVQQL